MKEITKKQVCLVVRGGIEFWVDEERAENIKVLIKGGTKYLELGGDFLNTFEVVGIFTPESMEEKRRRNNGQWKCSHGEWHDRGVKCECHRFKNGKEFISGQGWI